MIQNIHFSETRSKVSDSDISLIQSVAQGFTTNWKSYISEALRSRTLYSIENLLNDPATFILCPASFIEAGISALNLPSPLQPELSLRSLTLVKHQSAAATLMTLTSLGIPGDWRVQIPKPMVLFLGGESLTVRDFISLSSNGIVCQVDTLNFKYIYRRYTAPGGIECWKLYNPILNEFFDGNPISIYCLEKPIYAPALLGSHSLSTSNSSKIASDLNQAIEILKFSKFEVYHWVEWLLRAAVFVESNEFSTSGTANYWIGLSFFSHPIDIELLALLLVHETAHQAFHLLQAHCPLVFPGCNELYYSSLKKQDRPLDRVLLALHACKLMLSFIDSLIEAGDSSTYWVQQRSEIRGNILEMLSSLTKPRGLTPCGEIFLHEMRLEIYDI